MHVHKIILYLDICVHRAAPYSQNAPKTFKVLPV